MRNEKLSWEALIDKGEIDRLKELVAQDNTLLSVLDSWGNTALHSALWAEHAPLVRHLVNAGANVDAKADTGETCLECAVEANSKELVGILLDAGARADQLGTNFRSPLHLACVRNYVDIVAYLIERRADMNAPTGEWNETPLMDASIFACVEVVEFLIANGASPLPKDIRGRTALELARHWQSGRPAYQDMGSHEIEKTKKKYSKIIDLLEAHESKFEEA